MVVLIGGFGNAVTIGFGVVLKIDVQLIKLRWVSRFLSKINPFPLLTYVYLGGKAFDFGTENTFTVARTLYPFDI